MEHPQPSPVLPDDPEQCRLLGDVRHARGRLDDALPAYAQAMSLRRDDLNTLNNTANLLRQMGRVTEALYCYDRALASALGHAVVLCNRALALRDVRNNRNNRGVLLRDCGQLCEGRYRARHLPLSQHHHECGSLVEAGVVRELAWG